MDEPATSRPPDASFEATAAALLQDYWRLFPVEATHAGVHDHDGALPDLSERGLDERRGWRAASRRDLEALGAEGLTASERLDARVALAEVAGEDILDEWGEAHRSPALYVEQALGGLNDLLARPAVERPPDEQYAALLSRLEATPRLLAQGRANLDGRQVAPELAEIGITAARGAVAFLSAAALPEPARQQALEAVTEYQAFLERDLHPQGSAALGTDLFERLLREKHGVHLSARELEQLGRGLADDLEEQVRQAAAAVDPGYNWREVVEALKADHPTREALGETYAREAARARAFVEERGLVSIPAGERCEVLPTAAFLRATMPLGHFDRVPPFAPSDNRGILYITPIDPTLDERKQDELLRGHSHVAVRAICLHETYPGHHLQFWHAKLRATPIRRQFTSTLFSEGWALYCEEMMEEAGYLAEPALRLWRLRNAMWRAVRIVVDVGIHCRGLSVEDAAGPLVERGGLEPHTARGEALRYTTSPTQPSSYVLGRNRIVELRREQERRLGARFDLRAFHDRLLGFGTVSPALIPDDLDLGPGSPAPQADAAPRS